MAAGKSLNLPSLTLPTWGALLIGLQCVYLVLELVFNARLVDSVVVADPDYFDYIAQVGRVLSGVGCTLVAFGALRRWQTHSPVRKVGGHLLVALIAFPTVYVGQEKLIDYLVDGSSAEQRMHAQHVALLKRGLASNVVVFKDIEFVPEDIERPEAKTFINTIGFSVFFAPDYISSVVENSDPILNHLAKRQANDRLPEAYAQYLNAREQVEALSVQYNEANDEHHKRAREAGDQARAIWKDVYVELQAQWADLKDGQKGPSLTEAFDRLYDRLEVYFIARARCDGSYRKACLQRVNREYNEQVRTAFGQPVAPEYWCKPIPERTTRVVQAGRFVEKQIGGGFDCSAQHREYIRQKFLKLQGVSSFEYRSFQEFVASREVAEQLREQLAEKDIRVPSNYRLTNYQGFIKGVESELIRQLEEAFAEQAETRFGTPVKPGLSTDAFLAHAVVQGPLKQALAVGNRAEPVSLNLSERAFRDDILIPKIERILAQERARLLAQTAYFADGEPYEADGKLYVRSVLIPPVAMALSLFFGLLNLVSLLALGLSKLGLSERVVRIGRNGVLPVLLLVGPILYPSEIAQTPQFQKIVDETQDSLGGFRYAVVWLTSLQPAVYPLGDAFGEVLGVFDVEAGEGA